jgi:3-oxoacyl-[acyl-carrier protein] reductase
MVYPVALVTGASRGIGRAIGIALAKAGYDIVVNFATSEDAAQEVVADVEGLGRRALAVKCDVGVGTERVSLVKAALEAFGRVDVLVNNAGISSIDRQDLLEATESSFDAVMATNLKGPFFLSQSIARQMLDQARIWDRPRGVLINISSISAFAASVDRADYCLSKAAMGMMTKLFAARLALDGVLVYEVCPGIIQTDMTAAVQEKYDKLIAEGISPIRRWGQPEDVAKAAVMLASGVLSFSTGERIHVDGGFHIRRL